MSERFFEAQLPPLERDRVLKRARFLAHVASWRWQHPSDSRTAKVPCLSTTLRMLARITPRTKVTTECRFWVITGKAQSEHMFSGLPQ